MYVASPARTACRCVFMELYNTEQCQVKNIRLCQISLLALYSSIILVCVFELSMQGIMLVYDITQEQTYSNVSKWLRNIEEVSTVV